MSVSRKWRFGSLFLVGGLVLAACGDDGGSPAAAPTGQPDAPASPEGEATDLRPEHYEHFAGTFEEIVAAAQNEPPVRVAGIIQPQETGLLEEGFAEMFPDVPMWEFENVSGVEPRERIINEYLSGLVTADIVAWGPDMVQRVYELELNALPDWRVFDGTDVEINQEKVAWDDFNGTFVATGATQFFIAYNTDLLSADQVPPSMWDCADPAYRGQFMIDTRPSAPQAYIGLWGEDGLREWAAAIADNDPAWSRGPGALAHLSAGERAIHCGTNGHWVTRYLDDAGDEGNIDFIVPEDMLSAAGSIFGIARETESPNASLLIAAYWASQHGELAIDAAQRAYGNPRIEGTWMYELVQEAGVNVFDPGWQRGARADEALDIIMEEWGFPSPQLD